MEILSLAKKLSLPVAEVPVNWVNQSGSKGNLVTDSMKMLTDILKIRFKHHELGVPYIMEEYHSENE
jgi:hypothetical protein